MLAVSLLFVYAPTFFIEFGIHNDYSIKDTLDEFSFRRLTSYLRHTESMHLCYVGRPLNAILFNIHEAMFHTITDFAYGRVISSLVASACAVLLFRFLQSECRVKPAPAFAVSFSIFTIPSCYVYLLWHTNFIPGIFNVLFASCLYGFVHLVWRRYDDDRKRLVMFGLLPALFLLVSSFLIYPPSTFSFLIFSFAMAVFAADSRWPQIRRYIVRDLTLVTLAMGIYYAVCKVLVFPLFRWYFGSKFTTWDPVTYSYSLSLNANHWIGIVRELARIGLRLWHTDTCSSLMPSVLAITFGVSAAMVLRRKYRGEGGDVSGNYLLQRWITGVVILLLSLSPILVSPGGFVAYRTVFVPIALLAMLFVGALCSIAGAMKFGRFLPRFVALFVVIVALVSQRNLVNIAVNANMEYNFLRSRLTDLRNYEIHPVRIQIERPPEESVFVDYPLHLDLALIACESIVHFVAEEMNIDRNKYVIEYFDYKKMARNDADDVLQIDMNDLLYRKHVRRVTNGRH